MTTPHISVVVCSPAANDSRFERLVRSLSSLKNAEQVEVVRITDAMSLSEGYNKGVKRSRGEIVFFTHDDVEILSSGFWSAIKESLESMDVVLPIGSDEVVDADWTSSGRVFGACGGSGLKVCVGDRVRDMTDFSVLLFGDPSKCGKVLLTDAFWFATKRSVLDRFPFDEETFDGFHFGAEDFVYRVGIADLCVGIIKNSAFIHHSDGVFGDDYRRYKAKFEEKHRIRASLHPNRNVRMVVEASDRGGSSR